MLCSLLGSGHDRTRNGLAATRSAHRVAPQCLAHLYPASITLNHAMYHVFVSEDDDHCFNRTDIQTRTEAKRARALGGRRPVHYLRTTATPRPLPWLPMAMAADLRHAGPTSVIRPWYLQRQAFSGGARHRERRNESRLSILQGFITKRVGRLIFG